MTESPVTETSKAVIKEVSVRRRKTIESWPIADRHYRVTWADAVCAHDEALLAGGAPGILSRSAVESAIARPYHGYHPRIHQNAAALVHGIVTNHGFVDGNKRTAVYLVELLAVRSGYRLVVDDLALADVVTAVARGDVGYDQLAVWFKERLKPVAE